LAPTFMISPEMQRQAKKATEADLCDHCLGRLFAKVGKGLTDQERGEMIRLSLQMDKMADCTLCGSLFDELPNFAKLVQESLEPLDFESFLVGTRIDVTISEKEETLWSQLGITSGETIKAEMNREVGKLVEAAIEKTVEFASPDVVAVLDTRFDSITLQIAPIFLYGRYRKLTREIPQTRWPCRKCRGRGIGCEQCGGTGKQYMTSVEEEVAAEVMKLTQGEEHAFHGMGREDIDARMLGNGRPFILEITRPKKRKMDMETLQDSINTHAKGKVSVSHLRSSTRSEVVEIKEMKVNKTYEVTVAFDGPVPKEKLKKVVSSLEGVQINQYTPSRVAHRRALRERKRIVVAAKICEHGERSAILKVTGESGIYIKELVHGDEGRTMPNISNALGTPCQVEALDVVWIHDTKDENGSNESIGTIHPFNEKGSKDPEG